jgi:nucleoside 2-deoxyribosyltransferase
MYVYLAGPIFGATDEDCHGWRERIKAMLPEGWEALDPMSRDYRGNEDGNEAEIVRQDKQDILGSEAVIVNASRPSWGTAMEVHFAGGVRKNVIAIVNSDRVSPWLRHYARHIVKTEKEAVALL